MAHDKELEIQLQFLDEAQEYLQTMETALLGIASSGIDTANINAALRAAHSIKGGAGLMRFTTLSELSHRLEDGLKVLKVQRQSLEIDAEIEGLMLTGLDCLRQVIERDRASFENGWRQAFLEGQIDTTADTTWLKAQVYPIFDLLHERLGDPEAEDAHSLLSPEEGQDIIPMLFQTEVEGCLQRLESVLETQAPCLREEVEILAQELGGLGEMLQIDPFTQLCESVGHELTNHPDQTEAIARQALEAWRRSQILVLAGNLEALPISLEAIGEVTSTVDIAADTFIVQEPEADEDLTAPLDLIDRVDATYKDTYDTTYDTTYLESHDESLTDAAGVTADTHVDYSVEESVEDYFNRSSQTSDQTGDQTSIRNSAEILTDASVGFSFEESGQPSVEDPGKDVSTYSAAGANVMGEVVLSEPSVTQTPSEPFVLEDLRPASSSRKRQTTEYQVSDNEPNAPPPRETQDNTVRVPVKQLNQLNDLFGELTIERNALDLNLKRLRGLVQTLSHRVRVLEQSNADLRTTYDKITVQTTPRLPLLLPSSDFPSPFEATAQEFQGIDGRFDSLEMDRYGDMHSLSQEVMETIVQIQEVTSDIELGLEDTDQTTRELNKTARQLQTKLTQVRMRPIADILDRFPRALREMSLQYGKPVQLRVQGSNTLVDRNILEAINDPLMHLLRNAFDHGIETPDLRDISGKPSQGTIEIRAFHRNNRTYITISDDGAGIPLDKIRARAAQMGLDQTLLAAASDEELLSLIFEPGFSTAASVTALSGRGVGMDVVRNNLKQVRGDIKVNTQAGVGTTFTISVPFTLSVARVLLTESNGMPMAFPTDVIDEVMILPPDKIIASTGSDAFEWDGRMVQLIRLSEWLTFNCPRQIETPEHQPAIAVPTVFMVKQGSQTVGLQVDRSWGEQEVAIRQVEGGLPLPAGFSNCTILGDGRVVPLINVPDLLHWIASCDRSQVTSTITPSFPRLSMAPPIIEPPALPPVGVSLPSGKPTILIVDDSINVRRLLALTLEKAGYQVAQAKDGQDALDKLSAGLQVHAVICDIEMPRLDGYGFLARVKSIPHLAGLPIAMLTSRSGDKHRRLAMSLGAVAYFSKPYNEQVLLKRLDEMLNLAPAL